MEQQLIFLTAGVFLGFLAGFGLEVILEYLKRPDLVISIGEVNDGQRPNKPKHRFLHLKIENKKSRILSRNVATSCRTELVYRGRQRTLLTIAGRWSSNPEPLTQVSVGSAVIQIPNLSSLYVVPKEEIPPGESSQIAVGLKHDGEPEFYAFNNVSYAFPDWKNPDFTIRRMVCEVELKVYSGDRSWTKRFRIHNQSSNMDDFELEELS